MNGSKRVGQFHWPCLALVGALTMSLGPVSAANGPPELVFVNGKVITVDPSFSIAQAFSIKDGKFAQVGSSDAVKRSAGTETRVVDPVDLEVVPGATPELDTRHSRATETNERLICMAVPPLVANVRPSDDYQRAIRPW